MNAGDALDLALGREPFVKSFVAKFAGFFGPRRQPSAPAFNTSFLRFRILRGQIGADANHGLERDRLRSEEHTSELQSQSNLVCRLLLEKKKKTNTPNKQPSIYEH